jgi:cytochrome c oxidase subunit 3
MISDNKKSYYKLSNFLTSKGACTTHPFHMVRCSPWPFVTSETLFVFVLALVNFFNFTKNSEWFVVITFIIFLIPIIFWFRDIIRESTYMGLYTVAVQKNLRIGMTLFIISEIMFFFSLFWAFFHFSLSPSIWIGAVWPPFGVITISPWGIPLLNTIILVSSGVSITFAHRALCLGVSKNDVLKGLLITIGLGLFFMICQLYEFKHAPFSINDSVYGSVFFMITGFHGLHVVIGTIFIIVNFFRTVLNHFFVETHLGMEFSIWYWHFVDVIWIFVFLAVYWWGGI